MKIEKAKFRCRQDRHSQLHRCKVTQQQGDSVFIHFHVICDFLIEHKITDSETLLWMTQAKSQVTSLEDVASLIILHLS